MASSAYGTQRPQQAAQAPQSQNTPMYDMASENATQEQQNGAGNMFIYNSVRSVPNTALKQIQAGRLKGFSDINPMWRMKVLTETFGPVGFGWMYEIVDKRLEPDQVGGVACFVDINLRVKYQGEWSEPIPGMGGSMFIANERNGPYTSDECFKMALTDAIGIACKALGVAADVYYEKDRTKYDQPQPEPQYPSQMIRQPIQSDYPEPPPDRDEIPYTEPIPDQPQPKIGCISEGQAKRMFAMSKGNNEVVKAALSMYGYTSSRDVKKSDYNAICEIITSNAQM